MFGSSNVGYLRVYLETPDEKREVIWEANGNQGNKWLRGYKNLGTGMFRVVFEGTLLGVGGSIALDDIFLAECSLMCKYFFD